MRTLAMAEDEIRHTAYLIWLSEGRPNGREQEHWQRAERELKDNIASSRTPEAHQHSETKVKRVRKSVKA